VIIGPKLVILGKQGAGKGTQCVRVARHYVIPHISTGDIFRAAMRSETEMGSRLREILDAGNLVPDDVTVGIVAERLAVDATQRHGFILDGFPRTITQAEELSKLLAPDDIDLAIDLELPTEVAVERLAGRRVCRDCQTIYGPASPPRFDGICDVCGGEVVQRDDDKEESIRRRLALYEKETEPIITWYLERDMLVTIDGSGDPDDVTARLIRAIDRRRSRTATA
jgi:adenylate kinase